MSSDTPRTDKFVEPFNARELLIEARKLERELEECKRALLGVREYREKNPLSGPAKMFDAIADRLRAGEDYDAVLADYDLCTLRERNHLVSRYEADLHKMERQLAASEATNALIHRECAELVREKNERIAALESRVARVTEALHAVFATAENTASSDASDQTPRDAAMDMDFHLRQP